jgi:shikimate dehydrogenase
LHNFWLRRYGIDGVYVPFAVRPEEFGLAVEGLRAAGLRGINVTIPHKEAAFALCAEVDEAARSAGVVNTLVFDGDRVVGSNTDGSGFIANLRDHHVDPRAGPALILGAGGAARAVAAALLALGVEVVVCNRSLERAKGLAAALPGLHMVPWESRNDSVRDAALVVNATSLGMHGAPPLDVDLTGAPDTAAVADLVYVPIRTAFLAQADASGLRCVDGLGMLLHQAVPGFAAWFGVVPLVDEDLRAAMEADLTPA